MSQISEAQVEWLLAKIRAYCSAFDIPVVLDNQEIAVRNAGQALDLMMHNVMQRLELASQIRSQRDEATALQQHAAVRERNLTQERDRANQMLTRANAVEAQLRNELRDLREMRQRVDEERAAPPPPPIHVLTEQGRLLRIRDDGDDASESDRDGEPALVGSGSDSGSTEGHEGDGGGSWRWPWRAGR